jgi:hypothetical protein
LGCTLIGWQSKCNIGPASGSSRLAALIADDEKQPATIRIEAPV